jgi:hypothetical protein
MNFDAIPIGKSPPDDVNVVVEVPLGGEPIKYEMDSRHARGRSFPPYADALSRQLRLRAPHLVGRH